MSIQEFEIEFDPTVGQEFEIDISDMVTEILPDYSDLEIIPTEEEQTFIADKKKREAYGNVTVKPIPEEYTMVKVEDESLVFYRSAEVEESEVIL